MTSPDFQLFIIGGGVNGCGIARDAAGRGLRVGLAEMNDLASGTSSASTKLFHGGLRYLEYFEFALVRHALAERDTLLRAMPHIAWPLRFVLPYHKDMRFEAETPASKTLAWVMPWLKGQRPAWLIRLGLFLYDRLAGGSVLPKTQRIGLTDTPLGQPLQDQYRFAFEYSDCWVQDSRLVALNARDAAQRGATIMTRTKLVAARRQADHWVLQLEDQNSGQRQTLTTQCLINAAGPWAAQVMTEKLGINAADSLRLVRGSHLVLRKLYDHDKAYFFQGQDGRIIFAIPYEQDFTLLGTTDAEHDKADSLAVCTDEERDYLLAFASQYFRQPVTRQDIVWSYAGVRPLYDGGAASASAATRDYVLRLDHEQAAPVLHVFGGKITTYRLLAEQALEKLRPFFPAMSPAWTGAKLPPALPGGDFAWQDAEALTEKLGREYAFLSAAQAQRLFRAYGLEAWMILGQAQGWKDLGAYFGHGLSEAELCWMMDKEFAQTADDVLWRRSRLGVVLPLDQRDAVAAFLEQRSGRA